MNNYKYYYCAYNKQTGEQVGKIEQSYSQAEKRAFFAKHLYGVACIALLGEVVQLPPDFKFNDKYLTEAEKVRFKIKK